MIFDKFDTDSVATAGITFSNGNLTALGGSTALANSAIAQSLEGKKSGLWYVEFTCNAVSGNVDGVGVVNSIGLGQGFIGDDGSPARTWGYFTNGNVVFNAAAATAVNNTTYGAGDVIGLAIDLTNKRIWFRKNTGSWIGTSGTPNPATNTGGFDLTNLVANSARVYPAVNNSGALAKFTANFGTTGFTGSAPSGFTGGWTNTTAGTYFGSFATTGNNGNALGVAAPPAGDKAVSKYTATISGNVTSVVFAFQASANSNKGVIYADSAGAPGALLGVSTNTVTGLGEQIFTFTGVAVVSGTAYWFGTTNVVGEASIKSPPLTNGILFNTGPYSSPSNPFGASPSTSNFRYPAIINVSPPAANRRPVVQVCG
jgi:hypothetical protein